MKKFFSTRTLLAVTGATAFLLIFASCKKSDNENPDIPVAGLMAFNLAPEKQGIAFTLSGNNLTNAPLTYPNYTGGYLGVYTGSRTITALDASSGNTITSLDHTFDQDKYYSLFLTGYGDVYNNIIVTDPIDTLSATSGKAYIRYINAIADSVSQPAITVTDNSGNIIDENAVFTNVSGFTAVAPGSITIDVNNGSDIQANRSITVEGKKVYTALLIGVPGSTETDEGVQIRYIENGTLSEDTGSNGFARTAPSNIMIK
ncbi:MAG: DUF4397 domain-containing protein [Chitinophagaceae bacterium]|nr:DUF4397 domain-containing protein [Chitinophagaceae bacterium]